MRLQGTVSELDPSERRHTQGQTVMGCPRVAGVWSQDGGPLVQAPPAVRLRDGYDAKIRQGRDLRRMKTRWVLGRTRGVWREGYEAGMSHMSMS